MSPLLLEEELSLVRPEDVSPRAINEACELLTAKVLLRARAYVSLAIDRAASGKVRLRAELWVVPPPVL